MGVYLGLGPQSCLETITSSREKLGSISVSGQLRTYPSPNPEKFRHSFSHMFTELPQNTNLYKWFTFQLIIQIITYRYPESVIRGKHVGVNITHVELAK